MIKFSRLIFILCLGVSITSCVTNRKLTSDIKMTDLSNLQYFEPYNNIGLIIDGNKVLKNDSLSQLSKLINSKIIDIIKDSIRLGNYVVIDDPAVKIKIEKEVYELKDRVIESGGVRDIKLSPTIDSVLESGNNRFGLFTISKGYIRTKLNYTEEIIKTVALGLVTGILSGGMFVLYTTPPHNLNNITIMIVDAQKNNIAIYRNYSPNDSNPVDFDTVYEMYMYLFENIFNIPPYIKKN